MQTTLLFRERGRKNTKSHLHKYWQPLQLIALQACCTVLQVDIKACTHNANHLQCSVHSIWLQQQHQTSTTTVAVTATTTMPAGAIGAKTIATRAAAIEISIATTMKTITATSARAETLHTIVQHTFRPCLMRSARRFVTAFTVAYAVFSQETNLLCTRQQQHSWHIPM